MKIKDIKKFREFVWQTEDKSNPNIDFDFIGVSNPKTDKHGFFKMFHGINRGGVDNKIIGLLELAEDTQGVYEFIQNAADCSSKSFAIFYDENCLLAFNDGIPFSSSNVISILNEGDSDKSINDIGRFGVGFKIVHRLVGENDGLTELKEYKGPILFSWFDTNGINNFLDGDSDYQLDDNLISASPWLLKILLTNFPLSPKETIRDLDYKETNELFPVQEVEELKQFCLSINTNYNFNLRTFDKGSIFFLHLGKNKHTKVTNDITKLKTGVKYSLNFLSESGTNRQLSKIYFKKLDSTLLTTDDILEVANIQMEEFIIQATDPLHEQILSHKSDKPIKIVFGYLNNPENAEIAKGDVSNFYKFFPLEKEVVRFNFLIHSDAFVIEKSRREMQKDDRNQLVFDYLIKEMALRIQTYSTKEIEKYRKLFLSIYLSNEPQAVHSQFQKLYEQLLIITKDYIPVEYDKVTLSSNVVAKDEKLNLIFKLEDWGISKQWFYWQGKQNSHLLYETTVLKKYGIPKWNISDCILHSPDLIKLNDWIKKIKPEQLQEFISALEGIENPSEILIQKIKQLTLFKFSDNKFYSSNETVSKIDEVDSEVKPKNLVFHSSSTFTIKSELEKLELHTSEIDIEKTYSNLFTSLGLKLKHANLFNEVRLKTQTIELASQEKKNVFHTFSSQPIPELLTEGYFKNSFGIEKLNNLLKPSKEYPTWLSKFSILDSEHYEGLDAYLLKDANEIFSFIYKNWATIITLEEVKQDVKAFYTKVEFYYLLSANKKDALTNLPIVFVTETIGFKKSNEVYFHSSMKDCNYSKIQNAIKAIFELEIPSKDSLEFLSKEDGVFQITDDKNLLTRAVNSKTPIELTKDDVIEFVNFSISKIHENFFELFIISLKNKDIFTIEQKTENTIQVSKMAPDAFKLIESTEKLKAKYKILPYALKDSFVEAKGILTAKNGFYSSLLKDKELLTQPTEIYKYLFDTTSQKEYISQQTEILIPVNLDIDIDGSVYKILEWCLDEKVISVDEYKSARAKFKLQIGEEKFEVANSKGEIIVATITFSIAALLPKEPIDIKNEHTSNFLNQYSAKGLNEEKLKLFFGVGEDISADKVFQAMLTHKDDTLNSRQIEFLFLFSIEQPETDLSVFSIETLSDLQPLNQLFYTKSISFLKRSCILSDKYSDINITYCNNKILSTFSFNEKNELDTSQFKEQLNDEEKISLLEFVFGVWKTNKEKFASFTIENIYNFLGFQKDEIFLTDDYTLANEKLPSFYKIFLDDVEKISFSIVIGINDTSNSAIELRKYFQNNSPEKLFENIQSISLNMLHNSLKWLLEKGIVFSKVLHLEVIKNIYAQKIPYNNLFLFIDSFDTENNICFKIKKAEADNYLIGDSELAKLNNYEIPVKRIFEIQEKSQKNLVKQSSYPLGFGFNTTFKQVHIPDFIITLTKFQNLPQWQEPYFTEWKKSNNTTIAVYLFEGEIPRHIIFENEIINLKPSGFEFNSNENYYVSKDADSVLKSLGRILPPNEYDSLLRFKGGYEPPPPNENESEKDLKLDIDELRGYYSQEVLNALEQHLFGNREISSDSHRNALNDLVKLKFLKNKNEEYDSEKIAANRIAIDGITYIFHSARGSFAYIKFSEIEDVKAGCMMVIDFGRGLNNLFEYSFEQLLKVNFHHIYYQENSGNLEDVYDYVKLNSNVDNLKMLLVDPNKKIARTLKLIEKNNQANQETQIDIDASNQL